MNPRLRYSLLVYTKQDARSIMSNLHIIYYLVRLCYVVQVVSVENKARLPARQRAKNRVGGQGAL